MDVIFFKTNRLVFRAIKIANADLILKYRSNPVVSQYQLFRPRTLEDVLDFINNLSEIPNVLDTWFQLVIFTGEGNELIGDLGIHFIDHFQVEIGVTLSPKYQGKGYATESLLGVLNYLFMTLNKHRVVASVDPGNLKSIALLKRVGMRQEARFIKSVWFNEHWSDDLVFAILREEWERRHIVSMDVR